MSFADSQSCKREKVRFPGSCRLSGPVACLRPGAALVSSGWERIALSSPALSPSLVLPAIARFHPPLPARYPGSRTARHENELFSNLVRWG